MTATAELERTARTIILPANRTGWRMTAIELVGPRRETVFGVVPIIDGRRDGAPVFRGSQHDCIRLHQLLTGDRSATARSPHEADPAGLQRAPEPGLDLRGESGSPLAVTVGDPNVGAAAVTPAAAASGLPHPRSLPASAVTAGTRDGSPSRSDSLSG